VSVDITLDTGALIGFERRRARATFLARNALESGSRLLVPMPVIAEWWRGRTDRRDEVLALLDVEDVPLTIAKAAGEALVAINHRGPSVVDAIVMAFAAVKGGVVYTSDVDDLGLLRDVCFPGVRVLAI
jgi:predicted nucleic acid-binding protein